MSTFALEAALASTAAPRVQPRVRSDSAPMTPRSDDLPVGERSSAAAAAAGSTGCGAAGSAAGEVFVDSFDVARGPVLCMCTEHSCSADVVQYGCAM